MSNPYKNISLKDCRHLLTKSGCKKIRTNGGHEIWSKSTLMRPITIQTHIDPVPERIIKQIKTALGLTKEQFIELLFEA